MSNDSTRYPGMYKNAQRAYNRLIGPIRAIAKEHGYAVGVHGSLARDVDLMLVPWIEKPWSVEELLRAIVRECAELSNFAAFASDTPVDKPTIKPHGRRAWSIILGGGAYLDISITPTELRLDDETPFPPATGNS